MPTIKNDLEELRRQLAKGSIQTAYRSLLTYMSGLQRHFVSTYGESAVSGVYQGYMDICLLYTSDAADE
jgi:hypothetical protein